LFASDRAEHAVEHLVAVPLTQGQYASMVSFTFNEGAGRLQSSTLLKVLNAKEYGGGAKTVRGLGLRRRCEAAGTGYPASG